MNAPLLIVLVLSIVVGLVAIVLFGYASNQKAISITRNALKAHLLAVQLYRDQPQVVMASYGKVLRDTGRYLKLALTPLLFISIPITFTIVQFDHFLGASPIHINTPFLLTARLSAGAVDNTSLDLPPGITATAPPVHVPADNEVAWRLVASREGTFDVRIVSGSESAVKTVRVSSQLARVSPERLRDHFWGRIFLSAEPALPAGGQIESVAVDYPDAPIALGIGGYEMNWIWLFFIVSMIAGFIFKELLGIKL